MTEIASVAPSTPRPASADVASAATVPAAPARVPAAPPADAAVPGTPPAPAAKTREALQAQIDRVLAGADTSLRFRVDEESDRVVVAVLDRRGEVILQVPDETALALARRLARSGTLLDDRA